MNQPVNLEAAVRTFLANTEEHLTSYLEACVHCGQCADACHFYQASGDPKHTPAYKLFPIVKAYRRQKWPLNWLGAPKITAADLEEWEELLFDTCTMCGRCTAICPMGIDIATIVSGARQAFAAAGLGPKDLIAAAENARDHGSPLGVTSEKFKERIEWIADEHEVEIALDRDKADILLTISSIELMKYPGSVAAMAKLLNHAGVSWTFSTKGYEATNFGYFAGRPEIAKTAVTRIVDAAVAIGARTVVIPECGHAYGVMRWSAANMLGRKLPFEVLHISEFLAKLKREGKLKLKPVAESVTYHDPCQISRRGGCTEDARYLLKDFAQDFREMTPTANLNWCCGGGGGVQAISRAAELRYKVFKIKMDQVEATGAGIMISSCSNCRLTMDESKAHWKWDKGIGSLVEVIADHLIEDAKPAA